MGKEGKQAQVSMELLGVMGFMLLMIIPLSIIFFSQSGEMQDEIRMKQSLQLARSIAQSSESVYYLGPPSKVRMKLYMPKKVENITLNGREIVIFVDTSHGIRELVWTSDVNMTGSLDSKSGIHYINIKAVDGLSGTYVQVGE